MVVKPLKSLEEKLISYLNLAEINGLLALVCPMSGGDVRGPRGEAGAAAGVNMLPYHLLSYY